MKRRAYSTCRGCWLLEAHRFQGARRHVRPDYSEVHCRSICPPSSPRRPPTHTLTHTHTLTLTLTQTLTLIPPLTLILNLEDERQSSSESSKPFSFSSSSSFSFSSSSSVSIFEFASRCRRRRPHLFSPCPIPPLSSPHITPVILQRFRLGSICRTQHALAPLPSESVNACM